MATISNTPTDVEVTESSPEWMTEERNEEWFLKQIRLHRRKWMDNGEEMAKRMESYICKEELERTTSQVRALDRKYRLVDFAGAEYLFDNLGEERYVEYMLDFSTKHPVFYWLFYRWWLMRAVPKELRPFIPRLIRLKREQFQYRLDHEFALKHPLLFLTKLVTYSLFKIGVKTLTASVKVLQSFRKHRVVVVS